MGNQEFKQDIKSPLDVSLSGRSMELIKKALGISVTSGSTFDALTGAIDVSKYSYVLVLVTRSVSHSFDIQEYVYQPDDGLSIVHSRVVIVGNTSNYSSEQFRPHSNFIGIRIKNNDAASQTYNVFLVGIIR